MDHLSDSKLAENMWIFFIRSANAIARSGHCWRHSLSV